MFYEEFGTTELVRISSEAAKEHFSTELDVQKKTFFQYSCSSNQIEILEKQCKRVSSSNFVVLQPASLLKNEPI